MLVYLIARRFRKKIRDPQIRQYFFPALYLKIIGAVALGLIYQFYYKGGDTFNFYYDTYAIWDAFLNSPLLAFRIIFADVSDYSPDLYEYTRRIYFFSAGDEKTFNVIRLAGFFSFFTFNTYTLIAICFAVVSFTGVWALFRAFYHMYPALHRPFAFAIFYIPSVYFWGSGLMKDSITLGALGWAFYSFYFALICRKNIVRNLVILFFCAWIIQSIKIYIILCFLPAMLFWLFMQYRANIKNKALRIISFPFILAIAIPCAYFAMIQLTADNARFQLENIAATTQESAEWLETVSKLQGGSVYTLGEFDGTLTGMFQKFPRAVWLGLFQPHPWQAGLNPVRLLSSIEATLILILTLLTLYQVGLFHIYTLFLRKPVLIFMLVFCLIFAFGVALACNNYGTLVRYRIPQIPFFLAMLYIIRYELRKSVKLY